MINHTHSSDSLMLSALSLLLSAHIILNLWTFVPFCSNFTFKYIWNHFVWAVIIAIRSVSFHELGSMEKLLFTGSSSLWIYLIILFIGGFVKVSLIYSIRTCCERKHLRWNIEKLLASESTSSEVMSNRVKCSTWSEKCTFLFILWYSVERYNSCTVKNWTYKRLFRLILCDLYVKYLFKILDWIIY